MKLDQRFVTNLHGKDFVLFEGLLDLAHQEGLKEVHTDIVQFPSAENDMTCIVQARVATEKGSFSGIGDASPTSVGNKMIAVHLIRMAETRAVARAFRFATNIGMTAMEELGGDSAPVSNESRVGVYTRNDNTSPNVKNLKEMSEKQEKMLKGLANDNALPEEAKNAINEFLTDEYLKTSERASALIKRALEVKDGKQ